VQLSPIENTPDVLADLDPLAGMSVLNEDVVTTDIAGGFTPPVDDGIDRIYRPEALDVPVMVARDAPIATLDPARTGALTADLPEADRDSTLLLAERSNATDPDAQGVTPTTPQVLADAPPGVQLVAVRPAWVRVRAADGSVIFEGVMNAGDSYDVPATEEAANLRVGESGAIYFRVNGQHYGPAGPNGSVTSNLPLDTASLTETYTVADLERDRDLQRYVAELRAEVQPGQ
jgi:hypothetical protein